MNAPASLRPLSPTPGPDPVPVTDEELAQLTPEPVELDELAPENLEAYLAQLEADEADPNKPGAVSAFLSGAANAAVELVDSFKTAGVLTGQNAMAAVGGVLALDGQQFKDAARRQTALGVQAGAMFAATYPMIGETVKGAFKEVGTKLGQGYQDTPENRRKVAAVRQARDRALRDINNLTDSALVIADHVVGGLDLRNAYSETETQDMMKAAGGMAEVGDLAFGLGVAKGAKLGQKLAAAGARAAEKAATTAGVDKVADLIQSTTKYAGSLQDRFYRAAAAAADSKVPNFGALSSAARKVAQLQDERLVLEAAADSAERTAALTQNAARISEQKAVIEKIQADFTRRADEAALAANTRPVSQTIAGGAVQLGGDAMTAVGRKGQAAVDWLRDKRSSALGTSDEAVRLGDEVVERATGVSPGLVERTAGWVADLGENVSAAGRLMRTAESSTPYFQRLAKETDGWTRFAAQNANRVEFISRLGRGAAEATDGAFRGGAQGAMFGLLQGDPAEGAGEGFLGGFFGGSLRTIRLETDPGAVRARQIGDIAEARSRRAGLQQRLFDEAPRNVQLAAATFEATNPNLIVDFVRQKGSGGSYVVNPDGTGTATIDLDSRIALAPLLAHEVTHHIARNPDISADLRRRFLGDEAAGKPGYFTELKDGKLQPKADFAAFRDEYLAKLRDAGKDTAAYESNPELILHEVIAEAGVASLLATNNAGEFAGIGALRRKARPLAPLVERFARSEMVMNSSVLQRALMATGAVFREDGRFADGTGLFETDMSPELRSAVKQVIREYDLMNLSERTGQVESFSETPTIYSEQELVSNPELMDLVSSGFDVDIDPATGKRNFLTAREAKQREQEFIDDLILALDASPDISPGRVRAVTTKDGRTIYSGKYIPADVLESLQSKNKYNPRQLEMLAMLTDTLAKRPGTEAHFVYQPAMTRGSRLYKQRAVTNRVETPISILISRTGGVLVNTISQEKVLRNLDFFARKGLLGSWGGDVRAARADLLKYIDNTVAGREGAEGLGLEKRDALNALFGQLAQVQKDRNPVLQGMSDAQGRKLGVVQSRRLDRINQMRVLDSEFRANYDRVSQNLRPEEGAMGPEDSQLEGFQASMRESMAERIRNNPKSDYSAGDTLYTPKGTPVKFITDLLAVRKGKDDGAQRAYVQFPDGHQSSVLLRDLSPEPPAGQGPQFPRDIGSNVEFAVPPSDEEAKAALSADRQPKFGLARDLEAGTPVGLRIDIPAFNRTGKYVVAVHEKAKGSSVGRIVGYDTIVTVDKPTFMSNQAGAAKILTGDKNKFPIATVEGSFNPSREIPADINEWTAVGFDPKDHSYFYDKRTDEPVVGGSQAVSVGNSVFVKDPVYGDRSQFMYRPESELSVDVADPVWMAAVERYGNKGAGFTAKLGRTLGFERALRQDRGLKLWEDMSPEERVAEFREVAIRDLRIADGEATDAGDYMLDRALDPLDPMGGLYKALLKRLGADLDGDSIRMPAELTAALKRPGIRSLLPDQESVQYRPEQVETPEFKRWFRDSKIVDEYGLPKVVFHGSPRSFTVFDPTKARYSKWGAIGSWFAEDPSYANSFRGSFDERGQRVIGPLYEVYLSIQEPAVYEGTKGFEQLTSDYENITGVKTSNATNETNRVFVDHLKKLGFDGITINRHTADAAINPSPQTFHVVFDPTQIKSAFDNVGTFDPNNPDIQYRPSEIRPRAVKEVAEELGLSEVTEGAKQFGYFMRDMKAKGVTPRDVVKAYLITTSSINRRAVPTEKVATNWSDLVHDEPDLRPEDAFAKLLGTPDGQRYLSAAVEGRFDEQAANAMLEKFKPFGLYNTQREYMRNAAENLSTVADAIVDAVGNMPTEQYAEFVRENFKGISFGKVGFMSGMLGRGDLPTVDVRERKIWYGDREVTVDKRILLQVRDRLARLAIPLTEDLKDYYQTIVHHAVWDRIEGTDTSHADIKTAMLQFRPDTGQPKSRVAGFSPTKDVTNVPEISLKDLKGKKVFPILADLTAVGTYKGIDAAGVVPVDMFGGPDYPFIPQNKDAGVVWANEGKGISTRKTKLLEQTDGYALVVAMTQNTHASNSTTVRAFINTLDAYVKDGRVSTKGVKKADRAIESLGVKLPSVSDPAFGDAVRALSFDARKSVVGQLERAEFEGYGFPPAKRVLDATRDPAYHGVDFGDGLLVLKLDPEDTVVKLGENGTPKHPDYTYGVRGKIVGKLKRPLPSKLIFSEFFDARRKEQASEPHDARAFSLGMPVAEITDQKIEAATRLESVTAGNAQQMRAALSAATGSWQTSDTPVKDGGVGIADFVRALRQNKSAPSLTPYTEETVKAKVKSGDMKVFKLENAEIYFALAKDGDKQVISSVVNNEPGARGVAGPAVLAKAIEEGATHLDCFAVVSEKFPRGFLPELYDHYGFEEDVANPIGPRVDFSREYFDADWKAVGDNPEKKFADLLHLWESEGWNPNSPKPQVVFMRLRQELTEDATRRQYNRRLLDPTRSTLAREDIATRRGTGDIPQPNPAGAGAGGPGGDNPGADRGVARDRRGVSDPILRGIESYRAIVRELATLTDEDARLRGLDVAQLRRLREAIPAAQPKRRVKVVRDENGAITGFEQD